MIAGGAVRVVLELAGGESLSAIGLVHCPDKWKALRAWLLGCMPSVWEMADLAGSPQQLAVGAQGIAWPNRPRAKR